MIPGLLNFSPVGYSPYEMFRLESKYLYRVLTIVNAERYNC
jgi:hypothetical protein